jgi:hypothetical protein
MPQLFANGHVITTSDATAYPLKAAGELQAAATAQSQQVKKEVDTKLAEISAGWEDSGGTATHQKDVAPEVLARAAEIQSNLAATVRAWAKPGRERALMEMFGVFTAALADRDRLLLELRERLNVSPY